MDQSTYYLRGGIPKATPVIITFDDRRVDPSRKEINVSFFLTVDQSDKSRPKVIFDCSPSLKPAIFLPNRSGNGFTFSLSESPTPLYLGFTPQTAVPMATLSVSPTTISLSTSEIAYSDQILTGIHYSLMTSFSASIAWHVVDLDIKSQTTAGWFSKRASSTIQVVRPLLRFIPLVYYTQPNCGMVSTLDLILQNEVSWVTGKSTPRFGFTTTEECSAGTIYQYCERGSHGPIETEQSKSSSKVGYYLLFGFLLLIFILVQVVIVRKFLTN